MWILFSLIVASAFCFVVSLCWAAKPVNLRRNSAARSVVSNGGVF